MMRQRSITIDGRAIQSERLRDLRVHQQRFGSRQVFIFVPEPGTRSASEAFISAREKQRVFLAAGFKCTICRISERESRRAVVTILSESAFYIIQRPLETEDVFPNGDAPLDMDLDSTGAQFPTSALADTVLRILRPFIQRRSQATGSCARVGIVGSNGFFGREIRAQLSGDPVEIVAVDLGDEPEIIAKTHMVVSAVGKPGVVSGHQLETPKDLLIDVGYSYDEIEGRGYGDFHESCYALCSYYTPVPGGVGPLQVLTLVERAALLCGHESYRPWTLSALPAEFTGAHRHHEPI